MKSAPHGLPKAALILVSAIIFILTSPISGNSQFFPLPGTFLSATNIRHNQVFDVSPDAKIAITLTNGPVSSQAPFLTTFDPILGTEFDHKSFGFGPLDVRMAQVGNKLRAVVLASEGGPCKVYLFDVSPTGQLTQIAATQLTTSNTSGQSNVVLSGNGAVGFVAVHTGVNILGELVSFSLTDGAIIKRFPLPDVPGTIALNEGPNRRLVAFRNGNNIRVVNVLDATQPVESASVPLVPNGEVSGTLGDALTFSSDGHFLFFAGQDFTFAAIDVDTAQIVGTIPGDFRFFRVESFEDNQRRLLAVLSGRAGTGGTPALLLVDATNPSALTVVKSVDPPEFARAVFGFSHDGLRLYVAEPTRLVAFNLPGFTTAWEQPVPGFSQIPLQLRVYGVADEILGAWHMSPGSNFAALMGAFPASPPNVSLSDSTTVNENGGTASFSVLLSAPTGHRVTVNFSTISGTALDGLDYTNAPGAITFEPGVISGSFTIPIINDDLDEPDETLTVKITPNLGIVTRSQSVLTILDDDPPPDLTINDVSGIEVKFGNVLFFEVTLSAASGKTVTVGYATVANSASEIDFVPPKGTLTFFPGQTTNNVVVPIFSDQLSESDETFAINLSNPNNATITDGQGIGTIIDDDAPLLATEAPSQRAIAFDAVMLREPFLLNNPIYLGTDKRARINLFTLNLILTPGLVVTAEAVDSQQVVHQLPVESVQNVPSFLARVPEEPFLTQIVFKLPEGIVSAGDLQVSIRARNKTSNQVLISVKP